MRLYIRGQGLAIGEGERERVERRLGFALGRFGDRVGRVEVHLADRPARGGTGDKWCRVIAEVVGYGAVVVEGDGRDLIDLIDRTADRTGLAVRRRLDRARFARADAN